MENKHLKSALLAASIEKLPSEGIKENKAFIGGAIIKMQKVGNRITWGLGTWDKNLRKVLVSQDFDPKMTEKILEVYPYESQIEENVKESTDPKKTLKYKRLFLESCGYEKTVLKTIDNRRADKIIKEVEELQLEILKLGVEAEDATIDKLKEQLDELRLKEEKEK